MANPQPGPEQQSAIDSIRRWRRQRILLILSAVTVLLLGIRWLDNRSRPVPHPKPKPAPPVKKPKRYPDPLGIVLHDSDTPGRMQGKLFDAERLEEIHAEDHPSWATVFEGKVYHIGYHYVILADGTIEQGRPDHCVGCHTKKHNNWLGICVVGGFSTNRSWWPSTPTHAQMKSILVLCRYLMAKYHIPLDRVKRHRDLRPTWCPGDRFPYRSILASLRATTVAPPAVSAMKLPDAPKVHAMHMADPDDRETERGQG